MPNTQNPITRHQRITNHQCAGSNLGFGASLVPGYWVLGIWLVLSSGAAAELQPVYRHKDKLVTTEDCDFPKLKTHLEGMAFHAVVTNVWPAGLVPIFGIEKTNQFELRRRPARGKEKATEPLFFALPPEDEPDAAKIAGRWELEAVRFSGSKEYPVWELAWKATRSQVASIKAPTTDLPISWVGPSVRTRSNCASNISTTRTSSTAPGTTAR
jgi:hypothetical protein